MGILHRYFGLRAAAASPIDLRRQQALLLSQTVLQHCNAARYAQALAPANALIALLRDVGDTTDEAWPWPGLGMILCDHARILRNLDRGDEAIASAHEALRIWMPLVAHDPHYLRHMAASLGILASALHDGGRVAEAADAARQAARQYRGLVPADRVRFLPDFAQSLNDLGMLEGRLGNLDAALAAAQEAVGLLRELHARDVAGFRPPLAGALDNLGAALKKLGRLDAAFAAMEEAVGLYRQVLAFKPEAAQPHIGAALANRALVLQELGRNEEAMASLWEAVVVGRSLATQNPARLPELAASLRALAEMHQEARQSEKALSAVAEAIQIWTTLSERAPKRHLEPLAEALTFSALRHTEIGDFEPAARMAATSVEMRRVLIACDRTVHLPGFADSLVVFAHALNRSGAGQQALAPAAEAVSLWRGIAARDPALSMKCGVAEGMQALVLRRLGRNREAAALLAEAQKRLGGPASGSGAADRALVEGLLGEFAEASRGGDRAPHPAPAQPRQSALLTY